MSYKKILSIDGGGTRGITAAAFIEKMEEKLGKSIREEFDLIAGTSTGGIIALCLGFGIRAENIRKFYEEKAIVIFPLKFKPWQFVKNFFTSKYSQVGLKAAFKEIIKDITGNDSPKLIDIDKWSEKGHKIRCMVPVFDLSPMDYRQPGDTEKKPVNFRSRVYYSNYFSDQNELIEDIICRTTSGPTYFPIYGQYVDGGVAINHPAMSAVAYAINDSPDDKDTRSNTETDADGKPLGIKGLGWKLDELKVLSIGTGTSYTMRLKAAEKGSGKWGILKWARRITQMVTETNMEASEYYVAKVLPMHNYMRIQHDLSSIDKFDEIQLDVNDSRILRAMRDKGFADLVTKWSDIKKFLEGEILSKEVLKSIL